MPFGLLSVASTYQHNMRRVLAAQEARYHAVLEEMETVFREPPEPSELRWLMNNHFFDARLQLHQLYFVYRTR